MFFRFVEGEKIPEDTPYDSQRSGDVENYSPPEISYNKTGKHVCDSDAETET